MYYPKNRIPGPDGYLDKFDAADMLGLHPETFLDRIRKGRIEIDPLVVAGGKARNRHYYSIEDLKRVRRDIEQERAEKTARLDAKRQYTATGEGGGKWNLNE